MNAAKLLQRHENLEAIRGENIFLTHQVIECIGSGNNLVFKVKNNQSGEFRAVKEIVMDQDQDFDISVMKEIDLFQKITEQNHKNIIQYYNSCVLCKKSEFQTMKLAFILMELAELGNLDELVIIVFKYIFKVSSRIKSNSYLNWEEIEAFIDQSIGALAFLQIQWIAHCDIKPENILVSQEKPIIYKLCDIGSSRLMIGNQIKTDLDTGTIPFMSPELLLSQTSNTPINPYKSDVFSLGLIRITRQQRSYYMGKNEEFQFLLFNLIENFKFPEMPNNNLLQHFLCQLIVTNPEQRPDFLELALLWADVKIKIQKNKLEKVMIKEDGYYPQIEIKPFINLTKQKQNFIIGRGNRNKSDYQIGQTPRKKSPDQIDLLNQVEISHQTETIQQNDQEDESFQKYCDQSTEMRSINLFSAQRKPFQTKKMERIAPFTIASTYQVPSSELNSKRGNIISQAPLLQSTRHFEPFAGSKKRSNSIFRMLQDFDSPPPSPKRFPHLQNNMIPTGKIGIQNLDWNSVSSVQNQQTVIQNQSKRRTQGKFALKIIIDPIDQRMRYKILDPIDKKMNLSYNTNCRTSSSSPVKQYYQMKKKNNLEDQQIVDYRDLIQFFQKPKVSQIDQDSFVKIKQMKILDQAKKQVSVSSKKKQQLHQSFQC